MSAGANLDSFLFWLTKRTDFDSSRAAELASGIKEVLVVGKEEWSVMRKLLWLRRVAGDTGPREAAIFEIGSKFCLQKRMMPSGLQSPISV